MIGVQFDIDQKFYRQMNNLVQYSYGFVEGIERGKKIFFATLGEKTVEAISLFIDAIARQDRESLHHVYEWYQTGSPEARLFDIDYTVSNLGLSLNSTFRQSMSIKNGSNVPFYDKASMMEAGVSVTVRPRNSDVLVFEDDGQTVFTKSPVTIDSVGGATAGGFQNAFDMFVNKYFSQAFLEIAGISKRFGNLTTYKKNLQIGLRVGKSAGVSAGFKWITNLGVGV